MTENGKARLPPRWVVKAAWRIHRSLYRVSGGRFGLRRPRSGTYGMAQLTTTGRRSGEPRSVMIGYLEDGPNLVTMAMNGWADPEPAWWLNLQTNPEATLETRSGRSAVRGRAAHGDERDRLWAAWADVDTNLAAYAALRSRETAVVVLEPVDATP